jgi:hypothetical protein
MVLKDSDYKKYYVIYIYIYMTNWNKIRNPLTGRDVYISGKLGKKIIRNYIKQLNNFLENNMEGGAIPGYYRFGFEFEFCSRAGKRLEVQDGVTQSSDSATCPPMGHNSASKMAQWGEHLDCDYDSSVQCDNNYMPNEMILTSKYEYYWDGTTSIIIKKNNQPGNSKFQDLMPYHELKIKPLDFFLEIIKNLTDNRLLGTKCANNSSGESTCGFHLHISSPNTNINDEKGRNYLAHILAEWQGVEFSDSVTSTMQSSFTHFELTRKSNKYALGMKPIKKSLWDEFISNSSEKNLIAILKYNQDIAGMARTDYGQRADRYQNLNVISRPNGKPDFCLGSPTNCAYGNNKIKGSPREKPYPVHIELRGHDDFFKVMYNKGYDYDSESGKRESAKYLMNCLKNLIVLMNNSQYKANVTWKKKSINVHQQPAEVTMTAEEKNQEVFYPDNFFGGDLRIFLKKVNKSAYPDNIYWESLQLSHLISRGTRDVDGIIDRLEDESFSDPTGEWAKSGGALKLHSEFMILTLNWMNYFILLGFLTRVQARLRKISPNIKTDWAIKQTKVLSNAGTDSMKKLRYRLQYDSINGYPSFNRYNDNGTNPKTLALTFKTTNSYTNISKDILDVIKGQMLYEVFERVQRRLVLNHSVTDLPSPGWVNNSFSYLYYTKLIKGLYGPKGFARILKLHDHNYLNMSQNVYNTFRTLLNSEGYNDGL